MDVGQARDYLYNLSGQPAMQKFREHEETLEEIVCLLDDVENLLKHLDNMPDFEPEDREDREWVEKTRQYLETLRSYGDSQFLKDVVKRL